MAIPLVSVPFSLTDFLRSSQAPIGTQSGFRRLKNAWLRPDKRGAISPIPGYTKVNTGTLIGSTVLRSMAYTEDHANDETMFVVRGGTELWRVGLGGSGQELSLKTGLPSGSRMDFVTFKQRLLCFDGTTTPFEVTIEGSSAPTVTDIGQTRPDVSGATTSLGAAGNVEGIVKYFVSHIDNNNDESALSEAFGEIDAKDGKIVNLNNIPLSAATPNGKARIYRTAADGVLPFFVKQIEGTTSGTANTTDDTEDVYLGAPPTKHGDQPPAGIISAVVMNNRVWGITAAGDLYWTDLNEYSSWFELGNHLEVYKDDGDEATALATDNTGLIVFKKDHAYRVEGKTPTEIATAGGVFPLSSNDPQRRNIGCPHHQAVAMSPGAIYFYYSKRIYTYRAGRIRPLTDAIDDVLLNEMDDTDDEDVSLGYNTKYNHVWIGLPVGSTNPTRCYFFDAEEGGIVGELGRGLRDYTMVTTDAGDAEFWTIGGAAVYTMLDGSNSADGNDLVVEVDLPVFHTRHPAIRKNFCQIDLLHEPQGSTEGSFDAEFIINEDETTTKLVTINQVTVDQNVRREVLQLGWEGQTLKTRIKSNENGKEPWVLIGGEYHFQFLSRESA